MRENTTLGDGFNNYNDSGNYFNYTKIKEIAADSDYKMAPRFETCTSKIAHHWDLGNACILLIDTELESSIGLGKDYPFGKLDVG